MEDERCSKSARGGGAKHIFKSKCAKPTMLGALLDVEMCKRRTLSWREDARNTYGSQNVQDTQCSQNFWKLRCGKNASEKCWELAVSDHFWTFRCRTSAPYCGAKQFRKSKVLKTRGLGPLLDVQISKKCTLLWREAR